MQSRPSSRRSSRSTRSSSHRWPTCSSTTTERLHASSQQTLQEIMAYLANFEDSTPVHQKEVLEFVLKKNSEAQPTGLAPAQAVAAASQEDCATDPNGKVLFDAKGDFISIAQLCDILLRPDDFVHGHLRYEDGAMLDKHLVSRMKAAFHPHVGTGDKGAIHTIDTDSEPAASGSGDEDEEDCMLADPHEEALDPITSIVHHPFGGDTFGATDEK